MTAQWSSRRQARACARERAAFKLDLKHVAIVGLDVGERVV